MSVDPTDPKRRKALARAKAELRDIIRQDPELTTRARLVGDHYIAKYINNRSLEAWPAYSTVAEALGCCARTIQRAMRELEGAGYFVPVCSLGKTKRVRFPVIDKALGVDTKRTQRRQSCHDRGAELSGDRGHPCPPTLPKDPHKDFTPDLGDCSFPRNEIALDSQNARRWEDALSRRGFPPLKSYRIFETVAGETVAILPAPFPPKDGDEAAWDRIELYLNRRRGTS